MFFVCVWCKNAWWKECAFIVWLLHFSCMLWTYTFHIDRKKMLLYLVPIVFCVSCYERFYARIFRISLKFVCTLFSFCSRHLPDVSGVVFGKSTSYDNKRKLSSSDECHVILRSAYYSVYPLLDSLNCWIKMLSGPAAKQRDISCLGGKNVIYGNKLFFNYYLDGREMENHLRDKYFKSSNLIYSKLIFIYNFLNIWRI